MEGMIRVYLNNIIAQTGEKVMGLDELVEVLELREEIHGYLYQIEGNLTFIGEDYDYLRGLFDNGYCDDVSVDIQYSEDFGGLWTSKAKALIKLAGVSWDRIRRQAECPIVDNSYQSKINNNRNTSFTLGNYNGIVLSKNGVDVSDRAIYHTGVQFFAPFRGFKFFEEANYTKTDPPFPASDGNDVIDLRPPGRSGIFIYDALNLIIGMMADGEVDFASDYLSYDLSNPLLANEDAFSMLFTGQAIKHGSLYPTISFDQLFGDLHRLSNLWFALEVGNNGKPVFRVENEDYFRQANSGQYFNDVKSLIETIDLGKIYSRVVVGCSQSPGDFPVGEIKLIQHMQEEFPLSGTCNVDNALELRLQKLIISTNSIAKVLPAVSGLVPGSLVQRKFTTGQTTAGPFQQKLTDAGVNFQEIAQSGYLITNTITKEWSYIVGVPDANNILIRHEIFQVDNTGQAKNYEIYKPSEDDSLFDEVFLIQMDKDYYDSFGIFTAFATVINPPNDIYIYNETFSNANVITRHMGGVSQSIVNSLTDGNDEFEANNSVAVNINSLTMLLPVAHDMYKRIRFDDDTTLPYFDTNGNYNELTGIYTAPSPGYYSAYCDIEVTNGAPSGENYTQQIELTKVSASGAPMESESALTTITNPGSATFNLSRVFYLDEGDRIEVWIKKRRLTGGSATPFQYVDWSVDASGYGIQATNGIFGVDELINGGGNVPASDPAEARLLNIEIECSVSREDFDSIMANPFKYYHVPYYQNEGVSGYIGRISRGVLNGKTALNLFKKKDGV